MLFLSSSVVANHCKNPGPESFRGEGDMFSGLYILDGLQNALTCTRFETKNGFCSTLLLRSYSRTANSVLKLASSLGRTVVSNYMKQLASNGRFLL